uniref:Uncharacterized protein n=1 Tax=Helianthus annuus TaxID=4232 RepID=A0A251TXX0_HELAN
MLYIILTLPNKLHAFSIPPPPTHPTPPPPHSSSLTFLDFPTFLNLFFLNNHLGRRDGCDLCTWPNNLLH